MSNEWQLLLWKQKYSNFRRSNLIKYKKKEEKGELFQRKIGQTQNLGWAKTITWQVTSMKSREVTFFWASLFNSGVAYRAVTNTAKKVSVFGLLLVHIFPHSHWIWRDTLYSVQMRENTEQKNSKYGHFSCSATFLRLDLSKNSGHILIRNI